MSKFLARNGFKWIGPKELNLNEYDSNSSKGCVLRVNRECPKESRKSHNDYLLAPDNIEIKKIKKQRIKTEKNNGKDGNMSYKLMNKT